MMAGIALDASTGVSDGIDSIAFCLLLVDGLCVWLTWAISWVATGF